MDKLTDLKLQAFALWMAERGIAFYIKTEEWVDRAGNIVATKAADLTKLYEKETEEQYTNVS